MWRGPPHAARLTTCAPGEGQALACISQTCALWAPSLQAMQPELEEAKQAAAASEAALELAQGRSAILEKSWTAAASDAQAQLVRTGGA